MTFVVSGTGSSLPFQLIYQGKLKKCQPKFTFPSNFHDLFKAIIFLYLSVKKKEFGYPEVHRSMIIMDTFKGHDNEEMKRLCAKNNCELVIVPHNLTNKFQPLDFSISQSAKKFFSNSSTHGVLIDLANNSKRSCPC